MVSGRNPAAAPAEARKRGPLYALPEIGTMNKIAAALSELDEPARGRVLDYVGSLYGYDVHEKAKMSKMLKSGGPPPMSDAPTPPRILPADDDA